MSTYLSIMMTEAIMMTQVIMKTEVIMITIGITDSATIERILKEDWTCKNN